MWQGVDRHLEEEGCQALLVLASSARDPDLAFFVGGVHLGESFLIAPHGTAPRLGFLTAMERQEAARTGLHLLDPAALEIRRLQEEAAGKEAFLAAVLARGLELCGLSPGRLLLAGRAPAGTVYGAAGRLEEAGWRFVPGHDRMLRLRKRKSARDLEEARRVAAGAAAALRAAAGLLAAACCREDRLEIGGEPLTAGRLRRAIAESLAQRGLEQPEGNIVSAGTEAAVPHTRGSSDRALRPGETVVIDLFPRGELFADCTRTFCVGPAPEAVSAAHRTTLAALEEARSLARPGTRGWDLQQVVCRRFEAAGFSTPGSDPAAERGYVHGIGHGVGLELHEYPSFRERAGEEGILEPGDLFTLEPGLYEPEPGLGIRLEDLHSLGAEGLENLTPLPYDLDPRAWV